jgi:hypothetical protein
MDSPKGYADGPLRDESSHRARMPLNEGRRQSPQRARCAAVEPARGVCSTRSPLIGWVRSFSPAPSINPSELLCDPLWAEVVAMRAGSRRNSQAYLLLDELCNLDVSRQRLEVEMFIFHDVVDLFALFGLVHLGRVISKRRHKVN